MITNQKHSKIDYQSKTLKNWLLIHDWIEGIKVMASWTQVNILKSQKHEFTTCHHPAFLLNHFPINMYGWSKRKFTPWTRSWTWWLVQRETIPSTTKSESWSSDWWTNEPRVGFNSCGSRNRFTKDAKSWVAVQVTFFAFPLLPILILPILILPIPILPILIHERKGRLGESSSNVNSIGKTFSFILTKYSSPITSSSCSPSSSSCSSSSSSCSPSSSSSWSIHFSSLDDKIGWKRRKWWNCSWSVGEHEQTLTTSWKQNQSPWMEDESLRRFLWIRLELESFEKKKRKKEKKKFFLYIKFSSECYHYYYLKQSMKKKFHKKRVNERKREE